MTVSLGFLFNKSFNQVGIRELNKRVITSPGNLQYLTRLTGLGRPCYVRDTEDYGGVLLIRNAGEDWAASVTTELQGTDPGVVRVWALQPGDVIVGAELGRVREEVRVVARSGG